MEALGPTCECLKCLWSPISRRLSYVKDVNENIKTLNNDVEDLCSRKEDINRKININRTSKIPSTECQTWLKKLEKLVNQVNETEQEIRANRRCLNVCCFPDIFSRIKLGKRVANMLNKDVSRLKEASIYMGGVVLVDAPPQVVERVPVPDTEGQTSTDRLVQDILTLIRDDKIRKIGLWGMGGVGKTTVMKILNNDPELERAFDFVIWVTMSKNWSVAGVQNEIMKRLGMDREDNESNDNIARKLLRELEAKKYLLLLDDLWNEVSLEEVGVPMLKKRNGSKIVLTTRYNSICKQMSTDVDIKVHVLSKEEAWRLFHEKVGDVIDSPSIEPIARQVVEECGGLPLAVIVVGGHMRKVKAVHAWETALEELRSASFKSTDLEDKVFNRLKFSYDRLESDDVKNCFLYCALYPEDSWIPVDELVNQWRNEGFIHGMPSLDRMYKKGLTLLDDLIDDSLLERAHDDDNDDDDGGGGENEYVKMHDVIRDLALRITSPSGKGPRFLVQAGVGIQECGNTGEWEEAKRISLMRNRLSSLPTSPTCNSLETLLLQENRRLEMIPELFFKQMPRLRVVNLRETGIRVLPPSVSNLVNLQALYLGNSDVYRPINVYLPSEIGGLKRLEVLHIDGIVSLPTEVRELSSLRSLRLRFDKDGEEAMRRMCCDGVISCLCLLEDLRFYFFTPDDSSLREKWDEMVKVGGVVEEVGSLKHLTSLRFEFPTTECLDEFVKKRSMMNCPEFTQFFLSVKECVFGWPANRLEILGKVLQLKFSETMGIISSGIVELLSQAWAFKLKGDKTVEKLSDFGIQNLNTLQECWVSECSAMESIVSVADGIGGTIVLPNLQKLTLWDLPNLRSICDYPPSFTALRELEIDSCGKLRSVFTRSMIQHIPNLEKLYVESCENMEELIVWRCENMEEIVGVREAEDQVVDDAVLFFPRLKVLQIYSCGKLRSVFTRSMIQHMPNLEELEVKHCSNMEEIVGVREAEDQVVDDAVLFFPRLKKLKIYFCGKLRSVVTRSMIQHMPNLEVLKVELCSNMEEIGGVREAEDQVVDDAVLFFPRLKVLKLKYMDKLVRIWKGVSSQPWPSLEVVDIYECPNLKTPNLKLMDNNHHNASSSSSSSSSALREIHGEREWREALEWEQNDDHRRLQPLFKEREMEDEDSSD